MEKYKELGEKELIFAESFIETGNSLASAKKAGYSHPASAAICLLKEGSPIWDFIKNYAASLKHTGIIDSRAVLKITSEIAEGTAITTQPMVVGVGDGRSEVIEVEVKPTIQERLSACKLLTKIYGLDRGIDRTGKMSGLLLQFVGEENLED